MDAASGDTVSYKDVLEKSRHLAVWMKHFEMNKRDNVIGIFSENNPSYFYPVLASLYLDITVTTFNPQYTLGGFRKSSFT